MAQSPTHMPHARTHLLRRIDLATLLDTLLICAVVTILVVRTELYLTNYPQIGGHGLHIAHLLWGGLLMVVSLSILLAFVAPGVRQVAAVIGGIGFGLFMDELGKFVTADNNYFFKPTATIIYCVFVAAFLIVRQLERARVFSPSEYLLNVMEMVKDVPLLRMGRERRVHAEALLAHADQSDPLVPLLRQMLDDPRCAQARAPWPPTRWARSVRARLLQAVDRPRFQQVMAWLIAVWALALIVQLIGLLQFTTLNTHGRRVLRFGLHITNVPYSAEDRGFLHWALVVSTLIAVVFAVGGLVRLLRGQRRRALLMFERALLVSIFLIQVFAFARSEFTAAIGLFVDLALFFAVRAMLVQELDRRP